MNNLKILFIIIIFAIIILKCVENKLIIRFDTFFRRGFKRHNDKTYGVYTFCGKQGTGKTYSVCDWLNEVRGKKRIVTNIKSYYDNNKCFCDYNEDFYDIINKFVDGTYNGNTIIFFDEIFSLIEKGKLGKDVLLFLSQLRKRQIIFVTTAQEWLEINVTFRRYVRYKIDCSMLDIPILGTFSLNTICNAYEMKWDNLENEYVCPVIKSTFKKCSKKIADSYDTFETINVINSELFSKYNKFESRFK